MYTERDARGRHVTGPRTPWQDWTTFALGEWLFISPWIFEATSRDSATVWVFGAALCIASLLALAIARNAFAEAVNLALGLSIVWFFSHGSTGGNAPFRWDAIVVGGFVMFAACLAILQRQVLHSAHK